MVLSRVFLSSQAMDTSVKTMAEAILSSVLLVTGEGFGVRVAEDARNVLATYVLAWNTRHG